MNEIIKQSKIFIKSHIEDVISVELIAKKFGYSKFHFSRMFSNEVGISLQRFIIEQRLQSAMRDILNGDKVLDVAIKYNYETNTGFTKAFNKFFGYNPSFLSAIRMTELIFMMNGGICMLQNELYEELILNIQDRMNDEDRKLLEKAYQFVVNAHEGIKRYSGEEYCTHPLNVAIILAKMGVPTDTVLLGLLHDCNTDDSNLNIEDVKIAFGDQMYKKVVRINELNISPSLLSEVDINKEEDIVLVKLADRLHNMQTLKHLSKERWKSKAEETLKVFSPLAERAGSVELKAKLDGLSVSILE